MRVQTASLFFLSLIRQPYISNLKSRRSNGILLVTDHQFHLCNSNRVTTAYENSFLKTIMRLWKYIQKNNVIEIEKFSGDISSRKV